MNKKVNSFIIDTHDIDNSYQTDTGKLIKHITHGHKKIISRLNRLKSTVSCEYLGEYMFPGPTGYHQVAVESTMTEDELDHWLWRGNYDYIGVTERD